MRWISPGSGEARVLCPEEEEEEEEDERLCLQLETRERVQTNEAKSKRRRASPGERQDPEPFTDLPIYLLYTDHC
jgi:hypothetical protein